MKRFKSRQNRGFTIMELLCVIGIIVILAAITIPTFSGKLEKSRESVDMANIRSAHAQLANAVASDSYVGTTSFNGSNVKKYLGKVYKISKVTKESLSQCAGGYITAVEMKQKTAYWQSLPNGKCIIAGKEYTAKNLTETKKYYYLVMDYSFAIVKTGLLAK